MGEALPDEGSIIDELKESFKRTGALRPVVRTQYGVAAGHTRLEAVPEWPIVEKQVSDYLEHVSIALADNISVPKNSEWWSNTLRSAAEFCIRNKKVPKESVSVYLAQRLPIAQWRVWKYLPEEYKNGNKSKAGSAGGRPTALETKAETGPSTPNGVKTEPYAKGLSPPLKTNLNATDTSQEVKMDTILSKWGIPYLTQEPKIIREGEYSKDGHAKTYTGDMLLWNDIVLEVVGTGSSSNDEVRDKLIKNKGYHLVKFSNHVVELACKDMDVQDLLVRYLHAVKSGIDGGLKME